MAIDFADLPVLIGPRYRFARAHENDREKLAHAKAMHSRNHGKRHSVNKERSHEDRVKARKRRHFADKALRDDEAYHAAVRAYWRGERDGHP